MPGRCKIDAICFKEEKSFEFEANHGNKRDCSAVSVGVCFVHIKPIWRSVAAVYAT